MKNRIAEIVTDPLPEAAEIVPDDRFKFRHVHAITGSFVLLLLGVLIAVLVFAGRSQRWFIGNVTLRIIFPEAGAAGIRQGSEVYFLGTLMGTVRDVSVDPRGRMEAEVNIRRDFFLFVRADSSAVVKRKFGIMGDAYFEITRGHGKTLPEKNAHIVCNEQLPSPLESAVEEIRREAVPALKKFSAGLETWTVLGTNLITSSERLDQLILRVDSLTTGLQEGKGTVGRLLVDDSVVDDAQSLLAQAKEATSELRNVMTNLNATVAQVREGTARLPEIAEVVAGEAKELPGLVDQTQNSMRELERLIEAMQRHWLIRKYVDKSDQPPPGPLPFQSKSESPPVKILRSPRDAATRGQ